LRRRLAQDAVDSTDPRQVGRFLRVAERALTFEIRDRLRPWQLRDYSASNFLLIAPERVGTNISSGPGSRLVVRKGAKVSKKHDTAATPFHRAIQHPTMTGASWR
jgi:hypothetical protein